MSTAEPAPQYLSAPRATSPRSVLYLSFEGMLEPLGRSQVLSYLYPLSASGFRFALVSLERSADASPAQLDKLQTELHAHGIDWRWNVYRQGGVTDVLRNLWSAFGAARRLCRNHSIALVHARSYLPALVARMLKLTIGVPYLFDVRGYWVDEKALEARWFAHPLAYRLGKLLEKHLVAHAAGVVTLTALQADDFRGLAAAGAPVVVVPTCADFDTFVPDSPQILIPTEIRERLREKLVIGLVGSINASYLIDESFALFLEILKLRPDAHLLCISRQTEALKSLALRFLLPSSAITVVSVPHEQMPAWLPLIRWALLLLKKDFAKRGSMPTKLAEFFASGVRPIQYGCNTEVAAIVANAGSGLVLSDLSAQALEQAATIVAAAPMSCENTTRARQITRQHFGLEVGVEKYGRLLQDLAAEINLGAES